MPANPKAAHCTQKFLKVCSGKPPLRRMDQETLAYSRLSWLPASILNIFVAVRDKPCPRLPYRQRAHGRGFCNFRVDRALMYSLSEIRFLLQCLFHLTNIPAITLSGDLRCHTTRLSGNDAFAHNSAHSLADFVRQESCQDVPMTAHFLFVAMAHESYVPPSCKHLKQSQGEFLAVIFDVCITLVERPTVFEFDSMPP
jgi:hypothetical protein